VLGREVASQISPGDTLFKLAKLFELYFMLATLFPHKFLSSSVKAHQFSVHYLTIFSGLGSIIFHEDVVICTYDDWSVTKELE